MRPILINIVKGSAWVPQRFWSSILVEPSDLMACLEKDWVVSIQNGMESLIIAEILQNPGIVKSKMMLHVKRKFWTGFKSSLFVSKSQEADRAFNGLVQIGIIKFKRTKPLELNLRYCNTEM